uniref:Transposase (putative) gypsy type domain-containing protein n=1 Tax=Fagus sylvatica TaxID=28930 RepID=A0A2N9H3F0_FAGSY
MESTEDISSSVSSSFEERPAASGSRFESVDDEDRLSRDMESVATTSESLYSGDKDGSSEAIEVSSSESSREREEIDALLESSNLLGLRQVPLNLGYLGRREWATLSNGREVFLYEDNLKANLRLPFRPFERELLHRLGLAPSQLNPNAWRVIIGLQVLWKVVHGVDIDLTVDELLYCYKLSKITASPGRITEVANHLGKCLTFLLSPRSLAKCSLGLEPSEVVKKILKDLDNLPVLGKEDSKILKKAKTTKLVKKEKGSKGSVSSDNNKMMPPPVISTAKAPKSSHAPSVGQVLTVGLKLSSSETELAKAKTGLARNVAHAKTIAGLKTERDDLRGQVKKLKTEVNVGLVAISKFKSSDEFQDVTRRYYADGFEHFRKRVFLAFGNVQDWSLVKMFDNDDETTMVERGGRR